MRKKENNQDQEVHLDEDKKIENTIDHHLENVKDPAQRKKIALEKDQDLEKETILEISITEDQDLKDVQDLRKDLDQDRKIVSKSFI